MVLTEINAKICVIRLVRHSSAFTHSAIGSFDKIHIVWETEQKKYQLGHYSDAIKAKRNPDGQVFTDLCTYRADIHSIRAICPSMIHSRTK